MPNTRSERRQQQLLEMQAERLCGSCPVVDKCLTEAIIKHDAAGFVAGTTQRQRIEVRRRLNVRVQELDLDQFTGVRSGRQFDTEEILRLRNANPDQPLSTIAAKIGCSVSTVKRHLRRLENVEVKPRVLQVPPTPGQIMAMAALVKSSVRGQAA
ncbi:MAG: WhiB family transcriptional regulator [Propionibacteriaceae bacterium]|nr:WhiB family transcriptional regulator [Propionibacteriaceae bacterium]